MYGAVESNHAFLLVSFISARAAESCQRFGLDYCSSGSQDFLFVFSNTNTVILLNEGTTCSASKAHDTLH